MDLNWYLFLMTGGELVFGSYCITNLCSLLKIMTCCDWSLFIIAVHVSGLFLLKRNIHSAMIPLPLFYLDIVLGFGTALFLIM